MVFVRGPDRARAEREAIQVSAVTTTVLKAPHNIQNREATMRRRSAPPRHGAGRTIAC